MAEENSAKRKVPTLRDFPLRDVEAVKAAIQNIRHSAYDVVAIAKKINRERHDNDHVRAEDVEKIIEIYNEANGLASYSSKDVNYIIEILKKNKTLTTHNLVNIIRQDNIPEENKIRFDYQYINKILYALWLDRSTFHFMNRAVADRDRNIPPRWTYINSRFAGKTNHADGRDERQEFTMPAETSVVSPKPDSREKKRRNRVVNHLNRTDDSNRIDASPLVENQMNPANSRQTIPSSDEPCASTIDDPSKVDDSMKVNESCMSTTDETSKYGTRISVAELMNNVNNIVNDAINGAFNTVNSAGDVSTDITTIINSTTDVSAETSHLVSTQPIMAHQHNHTNPDMPNVTYTNLTNPFNSEKTIGITGTYTGEEACLCPMCIPAYPKIFIHNNIDNGLTTEQVEFIERKYNCSVRNYMKYSPDKIINSIKVRPVLATKVSMSIFLTFHIGCLAVRFPRSAHIIFDKNIEADKIEEIHDLLMNNNLHTTYFSDYDKLISSIGSF